MGPKYNKKDAAKDTDVSEKEVSGAWHNARNAAQKSKNPYDRQLARDWDRDNKIDAQNNKK